MDRIGTATSYQSSLLNILSAQARLDTAQNQVSTGKLASDLKGYAAQADTLVATRSVAARNDAYVANNTALADRLGVQDQALTSVHDASTGARAAIAQALANGDASALTATLQAKFQQAASALNTQYQGVYLFGGGNNDTAPVVASQLSDLTGAGGVAGVFKNGASTAIARLDDGTTVSTGQTASDVGTPLFTALQGVQAFTTGANGPLSGKLTPAQTTFLQGVLASFDAASDGLNTRVAQNGALQTQVSAALTTAKDRQTALTNTLGALTDADAAAAATRLNLAQTALQASAQVFSTLKNTSLLSVLTSGG